MLFIRYKFIYDPVVSFYRFNVIKTKPKTSGISSRDFFSFLIRNISHRRLHLFICTRLRLTRACHADSLIWHLSRGFLVSKRHIKAETENIIPRFHRRESDNCDGILWVKRCIFSCVSENFVVHAPSRLDYRWKYFHDRSSSFKSLFERKSFLMMRAF